MAQHVQLSARLAATVLPPASPSQDPVLIMGLATPRVPGHSQLPLFTGHGADRDYLPQDLPASKASSRSTVYELQSMREYSTILANKRLPGPSHDIPPTCPTSAEQHRVSPPLFDFEQLLSELTSLTASLPPMQAPPFFCRNTSRSSSHGCISPRLAPRRSPTEGVAQWRRRRL